MTPNLFDALRDAGCERLVWARDARGERRTFLRPDEDDLPVDDAAPPAVAAAAELLAGAAAASGDVRRIECVYRRDVGLRLLFVRHADDLPRTVGPVRRVELSQPESRLLRDACVAARHAALSASACELERGGAATLLHATAAPEHDRARFAQALAEELQLFGGDYWVDALLGDEWARDAQKKGAPLFGAKSAPCAETAALGAVAAVRVALGAAGPRADDQPPIVALQGLGRVGAAVGRRLAADGFRLVVSDREYPKIDGFLSKLEPALRKNVSVVAPYQIAEVAAKPEACDVFCPAAESGVLTAESAAKLRCRAVVGPATGVFDAASAADELAAAQRLHERGILYVPEWLASAGGAAHAVFESAERGAKFDPRAAEARTERAAGWFCDEVVNAAKREGRTPLESALRRLSTKRF